MGSRRPQVPGVQLRADWHVALRPGQKAEGPDGYDETNCD